MTGLSAEPPHLLDDTGGVGHWFGIGHCVHRGEPAERGGAGAGLDGLGVLATGLPQVGVQVDESGQRDQARRIEHARAARRQAGTDVLDPSVADQQVGDVTTERRSTSDQPARLALRHAANSDPTGDGAPPNSR